MKKLKLKKIRIGALPMIDQVMENIGLRRTLQRKFKSKRIAASIEVLVKSFLLEPAALYRIPAWAKQFDPMSMGNTSFNDDLIGRSLDHLFECDRATLQTEITTSAISAFNIDLSQIHDDSTSVKFFGAYKGQSRKAVKLKRGFSKDHRPDLNQIVLAVVLDDTGRPVCCEMLPGNTADITALLPLADRLRERFGITDICIVADRGMISKKVIGELTDRGMHYILGARLRNVNEIRDEVLSRGGRYREVNGPREHSKSPSPLKVKQGMTSLVEVNRVTVD